MLDLDYNSSDLVGKEIAELRKNGTVIYQDVSVPCFAFLGDTTCEVFEKNPILFESPVIIVECTFLSDDHQGNHNVLFLLL